MSGHGRPDGLRTYLACSLTAIPFLLAACTAQTPASGPSPKPIDPGPVELKVMEFNIEYGGEGVEFASVAEAIRTADADVVGIEEAWGNMSKIAADLGWRYYDPATQVLSRYPLVAPAEAGNLYTFVQVAPGRVVAIGNVHLPSAAYGPFKIERGAEATDVLNIERRHRIPALLPTLTALSGLADRGIPAFLVGDFNAPSHLDWTQAAVGVREHVRYPLDWPVSIAVERAGFIDSFREVYPDPVTYPGITWPASRPFVQGYNPGPNGAAADRIDFVYSSGPATPTDSIVLGEPEADGVDIAVDPWPTDHRATVSTFDVRPAEPPTLIGLDRRLIDVGDDITVTAHSTGATGERVVVIPEDGSLSAPVVERSTGQARDITFTQSTDGWSAGAYEALLVGGQGGDAVLERSPFWVKEPGAAAEISTSDRSYGVGVPIQVEWTDAPGNRRDWVGIYRRGADPNVAGYLLWVYTDATIEGASTLAEKANGPWPLGPGRYSVYLLEDDAYETLAASEFSVRD